MDYVQNYQNTVNIADQILDSAQSGGETRAGGGLAAREKRRELSTEVPDFNQVRAQYMNTVRNLSYGDGEQKPSAMDEFQAREKLSYGLGSPDALSGEGLSGGSEDFLSSLIQSESSGNSKAFRKNKDGRTFAGLVQMGTARLADYNAATGSDVTQADLMQNDSVQAEVIKWHVGDLRKLATTLAETSGMDINGLISVGHLGGRTGMVNFAKSGGKYNKKDELGTSLSSYYQRFKNK